MSRDFCATWRKICKSNVYKADRRYLFSVSLRLSDGYGNLLTDEIANICNKYTEAFASSTFGERI